MAKDRWRLLESLLSGTSLRARLARATGWMLLGTTLQQVFSMIGAIGSARILGPVAFGELGVVRSTTVVFSVLAGSGMSVATTRYVAALKSSDPARAGRIVGMTLDVALYLSLAAASICVVLAKPISLYAVQAPQLAAPIAASALGIVFTIVGGVQLGVLGGFEAFRPAAILIAAEGVLCAVLAVVGAWAGGVLGATLGVVLGTGILFGFKHRAMVRECERESIHIARGGLRTEWPVLGQFVIPAILLGIASQPAEWLVRVMLARSDLAQVGIFAAAFGWAQIVVLIPGQVAGPAMPLLTGLFASGDRAGFRKFLVESGVTVLGVAFAFSLPLAFLSPWLMQAYGEGFVAGAAALVVIVFAYVLGAVTMVFRSTLLSVGMAWTQSVFAGLWGIALVSSFYLLRSWGALGLSFSYGIAFGILALVQIATVARILRPSS